MDKPADHLDCRVAAKKSARGPRHRRAALFVGLTVVGVNLALLSLQSRPPLLIWNFSDSVPIGLYRVDHAAPVKGDLLAIAPAGEARHALNAYGALPSERLLLKHLAGASGDTVCRDHISVTVNGAPAAAARLRSRDGHALPVWSGCLPLKDGEIFVLAENPLSFDSRYFGAISDAQIIGLARPVLTFPLIQRSK